MSLILYLAINWSSHIETNILYFLHFLFFQRLIHYYLSMIFV